MEFRRELVHCDLLRIRDYVPDASKLRDLGNNLGISEHVISTALYNKRDDICEASYTVLKEWYYNQGDNKVAFEKMWEALSKTGLKAVIRQVLCKPPTGKQTGTPRNATSTRPNPY